MTHKILSEIINGIWMLDKQTADGYLPMLFNIVSGNSVASVDASEERLKQRSIQTISFNNGTYSISEYGSYASPKDAPENSIAVISINDVITKYDQECGPAGMITKADLLKQCYANTNIKGIIINLSSGGGEGYAAMLMNDTINKRNKPVMAFVEDMAASAAYYIASGCDGIFANREVARIGSIGTYVTIADYTDFFKQQGIRLIEVYADKSKDKNKAYYDALKGDLTLLKQDVNRFNEQFLGDVKANRGSILNKDESTWGSGKVFYTDEAIELGLIDGVLSIEELANNMLNL